ncbi:MAG: ABC transporter permease subunit [Candidatus Omnitrophica bacterium]|nr:ABC transporter permease subunit [Candidatus Omnitrophota bacterium]
MGVVFLIAMNLVRELFRKKDVYVLVIFLVILLIYFSGTVFFGLSDIYRYMKEIGLAMVFLFSVLISVSFGSKLMIEEQREKTIYPLLAKPITRLEVLCGKLLGGIFVSWSCFSIFFALFLSLNFFKHESVSGMLYLQLYYFGLLMFLMLNSMAIWLSMYFTFSTTVTLSYIIYFLMLWFGQSLRGFLYNFSFLGQVIYYLLPHFEFFYLRRRVIHSCEPLPLWVITAITAYAGIYTLVMLLSAHLRFRKRWL